MTTTKIPTAGMATSGRAVSIEPLANAPRNSTTPARTIATVTTI